MIKAEKLKELIEKKAIIYAFYGKRVIEINLYKDYKFKLNNEGLNDIWLGGDFYTDFDFKDLFETKSEAEHHAKYGNIEKTIKMPVPPTWEETKIEDFIKSNKTKPDNYKELFTFSLNNELFNLEIYSDENCKYFIMISDDENYYLPLFKMPLTKDNYYKALDKIVELWKEEV